MSETAGYTPPPTPEQPLTLERLAKLNEYDETGRALERLLANGELSDYDDELANRVRDAITIVRGVNQLAGAPLRYESKLSAEEELALIQNKDAGRLVPPHGSGPDNQ